MSNLHESSLNLLFYWIFQMTQAHWCLNQSINAYWKQPVLVLINLNNMLAASLYIKNCCSTFKPCWTANFTFRKFHTSKIWYQFFTARKKSVPIRHIFHTNISHFVKFAHVVKLYVAYMRKLHIDKIPSKAAAFCIRFQFFTYICQDFITLFKNRL